MAISASGPSTCSVEHVGRRQPTPVEVIPLVAIGNSSPAVLARLGRGCGLPEMAISPLLFF